MLQKLTFEAFQSLSCCDIIFEFAEVIVDFNKIPTDSNKTPLYEWFPNNDCEKNKESISQKEFQNLFQGHFYFKKGIELE